MDGDSTLLDPDDSSDTAQCYRVGLIGFPVEHSMSPAIQQPAFDEIGFPASYELWSTTNEALGQRVDDLRGREFLGANVTAPHKQAVVECVDDVGDTARRAGAVNTIVNRKGRLIGDNTDIPGLARAIRVARDSTEEIRAFVIGAGGAARGTVLALESLGAVEITLTNRTQSSADLLAERLQSPGLRVVATGDEAFRRGLRQANLVVNATSLGWKRGELPLQIDEIESLASDALVVDLVYRNTNLLDSARIRGLATLDGLPMLVYQGAHSFELWTGSSAPVDTMMRAAQLARSATG